MAKRLSLIGLILLVAGVSVAPADPPQHMAIFLQDVKIGHTRTQRTVADGEVASREEMLFTLSRGAASITLKVDNRQVETLDGQPLRFNYSATMGPFGAMKKEGRIKDGKIHLTATQGDGKQTRVLPYPPGALMAEGARLFQKKKGLAPGTRYSLVVFDAETLRGIRSDYLFKRPKEVPLIGRVARLVEMAVTLHVGAQQFETTAFIDESFNVLRAELPLLGMKLRFLACDETYARSPNGKFDLTDAATVPSPVAIARPRRLREATYALAPIGPNTKLILPTTDTQSVKPGPDGTLTVRVATIDSARGRRPYRGDDDAAVNALKPGQYIESDDPAVLAKARAIVGDETDALAAARKIVEAVGKHITTKDLTVGYASAAQTLKSARGDCTEHAVLTAALCRAAGIPCRIVVGVAYTDQFVGRKQCFVGHAWDQVFIGGQWVDLDASLGADAARITMAVGADQPIDFIGMVKSLGSFKITAVHTP